MDQANAPDAVGSPYMDPVGDMSQQGDDRGEADVYAAEDNISTLPAWKSFLFSKWGCAILLSTITILLILFIRPAFILKRRQNILSKPQINWWVVFILWVVLFVSMLAIPALIVVCRKKWVNRQTIPEPHHQEMPAS
jgi:hypothetical protein